eukprot:6750941-Prymnesium_polylepis.1
MVTLRGCGHVPLRWPAACVDMPTCLDMVTCLMHGHVPGARSRASQVRRQRRRPPFLRAALLVRRFRHGHAVLGRAPRHDGRPAASPTKRPPGWFSSNPAV